MNRLSAVDALFLYLETPETPMHVGSLTIFAPPTPDDVFRRFRDHTVARFDLLPSYRRRLRMMPLGIDHPVWAGEDDAVDLDYHIRRVVLPPPGTMEQLRNVVARRHMIPLDRARPLWQYYLIEGLADGGFAIYIKIHHSAMDGVAGISTLPLVYDFAADPPPFAAAAARIATAERPDVPALIGTAFADFLRQGVRAVTSVPTAVRTLAKIGRQPARDIRYLVDAVSATPRTIFNTSISRLRGVGTSSLSLADVKAVAKARHATINDVVLAISAGALRRYLIDRDALPDKPLVAGVPTSLREPGDTRMNNQVVFSLCRLATDVADPLQRLTAIVTAAREAKAVFLDLKGAVTTDISFLGAPLMLSALSRLWRMAGAADVVPPVVNVVISNVPGPRTPMYIAGAPATHYFPLSIPFHGGALNITVESYIDKLEFGVLACRLTVPRVQVIADYLVAEFDLLKRANDALARPEAIETIEIAAGHKPKARVDRQLAAKSSKPVITGPRSGKRKPAKRTAR
ncbi:MAG: wax ester/triacylglycerol synthase family O-acyltransferase [Xanthobacteraceae bacterium]|jgi:WS/DGAT/MGAT family acyltransferase